MGNIFSIIIISVIAFIPILIWAYIFSYLDNSELNSRRFLAWIFAWAISVIPVLYLEKILALAWIENFNIINNIWNEATWLWTISISLIVTILAVSIFSLLAWLIFMDNFAKIFKTYFKNTIVLLLFVFIFVFLSYLIRDLWMFGWEIKNPVNIWKAVFNTVWLVLLYYIIVWLLEESSKHFNFIPSSLLSSDNIWKWVLYWVFIALWFWFIENILYLFNITLEHWYSWDFYSTLIFRWIFSLFVHILCSSIVTFWFIKIYLKSTWNQLSQFSYIKWLLFAFIFSIFVHAIYDISLTLWFSFIIFIYLVFWYLYMTKIFYKEG